MKTHTSFSYDHQIVMQIKYHAVMHLSTNHALKYNAYTYSFYDSLGGFHNNNTMDENEGNYSNSFYD